MAIKRVGVAKPLAYPESVRGDVDHNGVDALLWLVFQQQDGVHKDGITSSPLRIRVPETKRVVLLHHEGNTRRESGRNGPTVC